METRAATGQEPLLLAVTPRTPQVTLLGHKSLNETRALIWAAAQQDCHACMVENQAVPQTFFYFFLRAKS